MQFRGVENQEAIYNKWSRLLNAGSKIEDDTVKMSTAIVLENAQQAVDHQHKIHSGKGLLFESAAGIGTVNAMGPTPGQPSYADTTGDARVPSIVIPMIRRIYPQLIAHKLVGVQPMQAPIGMAFAFRAKYGRFGRGKGNAEGNEIGYLYNKPSFTGKDSNDYRFNNEKWYEASGTVPTGAVPAASQDQGALDLDPFAPVSAKIRSGLYNYANPAGNMSPLSGEQATHGKDGHDQPNRVPYAMSSMLQYFNGGRPNTEVNIGDGADTSDAENWAVGRDMPEAGFEILKATVTAKTRKLGVQITRETEEDMKAMQGLNAQQEISDLLSYEIAQEMDRQLLGEIIQSALRAGNATEWDPAKADGRNQHERCDALYTDLLRASAMIAVKSRRGAANWAVASPGAAALLESQIYNPLSVAGGLGNANAYGKTIDQGIGVTDIGTLRNGTIKLYRDTLAGGEYILLGFKGNNIYDAGIIYLPYIPLELMQAQDPFTFNPITAARTRYGVTTNLFGAGQFYHFFGLKNVGTAMTDSAKYFLQ